jgi:gamma-glutamyltranspeptidase/glutathione hydrolase
LSRRDPVVADGGVVSAGDPLAASAALRELANGGNAVDAVLTASAVQSVVEMPWCGLGGDLFLMVFTPGDGVRTLNGSGRAPQRIGDLVREGSTVPRFGPTSIAVPGLPAAWEIAAKRYGSRPLADLLEPAIHYARDGFPVYQRLAEALQRMHVARPDAGPGPELARLIGNTPWQAGMRFRQPELAVSLEAVARDGSTTCYRGDIAARTAAHLAERGGALSQADLTGHASDWVAPLSAPYRDWTVYEHPLISLGCVLLQELRILEASDLTAGRPDDPRVIDLLVRCKEAAFEDAAVLGDPDFVEDKTAWLLSDERVGWWRDRVAQRAPVVAAELLPTGGDTTSTVVADRYGNVACLIQSLFNEWGSREMVPGTGILLNDRLANMRADATAPNGVRGGQRPLHTLNTYMVLQHGKPILAGATPGGRGQVQLNLQVLTNVLDFGMNIQAAVDAPRWVSGAAYKGPADKTLYLEAEFGEATSTALTGQHAVEVVQSGESDMFGNCTVVAVDPATGALQAAGDWRRSGAAVGC